MAPHYDHSQSYTGATSHTLVAVHQQIQPNPFGFGGYSMATPNEIVPAFANINCIQQRSLPRLVQQGADASREVSYTRNYHQEFLAEHQSRSPPIKEEPRSTRSPSFASPKTTTITSPFPKDATDINFGTEVDHLMKAIQAKSATGPPQQSSSVSQSKPVDEAGSPKRGKKRFVCTIEGCSRSFRQQTHLDIHIRKHTGDKPYECKEPGCGRTFSQVGNLRTHERRHTGEKPHACDICGKKFAQRSNVRVHKTVHNQAKPYTCRLDDCGKLFTQLGNLKSHQNKFHIATIRKLTSKFASIKDRDSVNVADKELWDYFANLYKHSNKGIKGRGKDRKVRNRSKVVTSSMGGLGGGGSGNMVVGVMGTGMRRGEGRRGEGQYEMFDADDSSQAGSHNGAGSPVGINYDDAPSDGYEEHGRTDDLAFGDRIY